ncbi:hypothetical protein OG301_38385 [Streptomyces platensis]|uniref:ATP-binding protein n=1 Tax=Streptomyces platensis TaxID=58346 RepID=UPI002E0D57AB|nr:hypothetical protein OG229_00255 [Streptomyces platensis]WTI56731.1 hypothetical protein OG301_38385 [Streptomyces platensis]WUB77796.1 hypothetical protein OG424_00460 [Streptomyces platensis]
MKWTETPVGDTHPVSTTPDLGSELAEDLNEVVARRAVLCLTGPDAEFVMQTLDVSVTALDKPPALWVQPATPADRSSLARALYAGLGLDRRRPRPGGLSATEDLIVAELHRAERLVVVPEAHKLRTCALETLYGLWAHGVGRFPLILAGHERLEHSLSQPALTSLGTSVYIWHRLSPS